MKESKSLEFKADVTNTFLKTVSAYANFGEGVIKFGVRDDGSVCGIAEPEKVCLDLENRINDSIAPKPNFTLSINKRSHVITLTVMEGKYKPYLYKGKAYRRSDTATVEVDQLELKRLTLEGSNMYYEALPSKEEDLKFSYLEKKLIEKMGISSLTQDMLKTFGFYTEGKRFNIAAELFADKNSFYGIDVARFGRSISEILDRETVSGVSVLEQYDKAVEIYKRYYQYEKITGIERVTVDRVPEAAFREAVANAIVHRTWDVNSHIKVAMYDDKIEIISPGGLPSGLSAEDYLHGNISQLRNPALGTMFFRMKYIEMFGTGIRRILFAYEGCIVQPDFKISDHFIRITLPVMTGSQGISSEEEKVLALLDNGLMFTSKEIGERIGWSRDKAIRVINSLKEKNSLKVIGRGRGTKYTKY